MIALFLAVAMFGGDPQPETNWCADPRNCRYVEEIPVRIGDEMFAMRINAEMPFVTPQEGLTIMLGESVVIRVDDDLPVVESSGPASEVVNQRAAQQAAEMLANPGPVDESRAIPMTGPTLTVQDATADRVRLTFFQVEGSDETMLIIQNGYAEKLGLSAHMQTPLGEGREYTTTCDILPRLLSLEHWPEPIVFIQLSDFAFSPDDRRVACD